MAQTLKLFNPAKPNTPKEIASCTCHRKLIKSAVNIEIQFLNVSPILHRVHEKNYNTVYVAITLSNNVGF